MSYHSKLSVSADNLADILQIIIISSDAGACDALAQLLDPEFSVSKVWSSWQLSEIPACAPGQLTVILLDTECGYLKEALDCCAARTGTYIIAVSDEAKADCVTAFANAGVNDIVIKPVSRDAIMLRTKLAAAKMRDDNTFTHHLSTATERNYRHILHAQNTLLFVYDISGRKFSIDPLVHSFIAGNYNGRPLEQVLAEDGVLSAADIERARKFIYNSTRGKYNESSLKLMLLTPSGEKRWFALDTIGSETTQLENGELSGHILVTLHDIHEQMETEAMLRKRAERDSLTGIYNRDTFFELAEKMIKSRPAGSYIMACFDVDAFKTINDQYGIAVGDEILKYFAESAIPIANSVGGIVARFTADNFAALYPNTPETIETVTRARNRIVEWGATHLPLSHSVGRYVVDDLTLPVSSMYDRSYLAKASVKGRYDVHVAYYDESMRARLLSEQAIVRDMGHALSTGQYEVYLQPQYDHSNGTLIGAEALVRWKHPERGMISPAEFIPIFERSGFIYALDKYVWEQVCILINSWKEKGLASLPVSVNISRYDFFQPDFIDTILELTDKHSIPHDALRLEITESAFSQSPQQLIDMVKILRKHGFSVEIDDFGSGYSSLGTLKDVPADILKLDMRFFEAGDDAQRGGNIVNAVVRMAKWLHMPVIAEGVETVTQADFLSSIGCPYIQGYVYSKPVAAAEYETILQNAHYETPMTSSEALEQLNNDAFWDPQSMETLIFTSYVGGACLFEFSDEKVEILRVNKKFIDTIRTGMTETELTSVDISDYLSEESCVTLLESIHTAIEKQDEVSFEMCIDRHSSSKNIHLNATIRVIACTGQRYLFYCLLENITERKLAQLRVQRTDRQLTLLNEISHDLLLSEDPTMAIEVSLEKILEYFDGERAFVYEFDWVSSTLSNTSEVCAPGFPSKIDKFQGLSLFSHSLWLKPLETAKHIIIRDTASLDDSHTIEREALLRSGVTSLFILPFYSNSTLMGFMGVDNPKQNLSFVGNLDSLGDYLAVMLTRRDMNATLERERDSLRYLIDNTANGFVTFNISAYSTLKPTFVNEHLAEMTGHTTDELFELMKEDAYFCIHPDDRPEVEDIFKSAIVTAHDISFKCRIVRKDGSNIWIKAGGIVGHENDGSTLIDLCVTDISEETEAVRGYINLLDNLPCGAGLYELKDGMPSLIYVNKKYMTYVERTSEEFIGLKSVNSIHPDDIPTMRQAIASALAGTKTLRCALRIIHANGYFIPFDIHGNVVETNGNLYLYVTFNKIDQ